MWLQQCNREGRQEKRASREEDDGGGDALYEHARDAGRLKRRDEAADHGATGDARDDAGAARRERTEHADLGAQRAEVGDGFVGEELRRE